MKGVGAYLSLSICRYVEMDVKVLESKMRLFVVWLLSDHDDNVMITRTILC